MFYLKFQTVVTQIRGHVEEPSDLGLHCLKTSSVQEVKGLFSQNVGGTTIILSMANSADRGHKAFFTVYIVCKGRKTLVF